MIGKLNKLSIIRKNSPNSVQLTQMKFQKQKNNAKFN